MAVSPTNHTYRKKLNPEIQQYYQEKIEKALAQPIERPTNIVFDHRRTQSNPRTEEKPPKPKN